MSTMLAEVPAGLHAVPRGDGYSAFRRAMESLTPMQWATLHRSLAALVHSTRGDGDGEHHVVIQGPHVGHAVWVLFGLFDGKVPNVAAEEGRNRSARFVDESMESRVLARLQRGEPHRAIAAAEGCSTSYVQRLGRTRNVGRGRIG